MQHRPSKQFIIRGSIAVGIVVIALVVQTDWFGGLFDTKPLPVMDPNTTVGDIVTQDTNGNGIADWEEKLWGLDPSVLYTNGVPNKQIIENKKRALGATDANANPINDTDRLARELYVLALALGQSETVDQEVLTQISAKIGTSINIKEATNRYSLKDLRTVTSSDRSLRTYYAAMTALVEKHKTDTKDIAIIISALETADTTQLPQLAQSAATYAAFAKDMSALSVPIGVAPYHLAMMNSIAGIAESLPYLVQLNDNAIASLIGIALYRQYNLQLTTALINTEDYLSKYGILQP